MIIVFICPSSDFVSSLLAHGKGAAFFVLPNTGMLGPFETQTVVVTAYTDMWGEYRDNLMCKVWWVLGSCCIYSRILLCTGKQCWNRIFLLQVGDLETTLIQIQMTVTGCPLYFQITGPLPVDHKEGPIIQSVPLSPYWAYLTTTLNNFRNVKYLFCFASSGLECMCLEGTQSPALFASTIPPCIVSIIIFIYKTSWIRGNPHISV